jgi:hypothetical protein
MNSEELSMLTHELNCVSVSDYKLKVHKCNTATEDLCSRPVRVCLCNKDVGMSDTMCFVCGLTGHC